MIKSTLIAWALFGFCVLMAVLASADLEKANVALLEKIKDWLNSDGVTCKKREYQLLETFESYIKANSNETAQIVNTYREKHVKICNDRQESLFEAKQLDEHLTNQVHRVYATLGPIRFAQQRGPELSKFVNGAVFPESIKWEDKDIILSYLKHLVPIEETEDRRYFDDVASVSVSKVKDVMETYAIKPCEYYYNELGNDVFAAESYGPYDKAQRIDRTKSPKLARALEVFQTCRELVSPYMFQRTEAP